MRKFDERAGKGIRMDQANMTPMLRKENECGGMISGRKWVNSSGRLTEIWGRQRRLMTNEGSGGRRAEKWWKHDDVEDGMARWRLDPEAEQGAKKRTRERDKRCRLVKWKAPSDDERVKTEELEVGRGEWYNRHSSLIEDTERESVLEISAGDKRRIKPAHSQSWVKRFSTFSQIQK